MILCHPKDIKTKPGSSVEFFIETSRTAIAHEWHFQEQTISSDDADYRGPTTERLTVTKCLPKHKGAYKCVVTNTFGKTFTSESATLTIGKLALYMLQDTKTFPKCYVGRNGKQKLHIQVCGSFKTQRNQGCQG